MDIDITEVKKTVGRPKNNPEPVEPVELYAFSVESEINNDKVTWYPVVLTIDKTTKQVINTKRLAPRGTTLVAAMLSLEPHMIPYTRGTRLKNHGA